MRKSICAWLFPMLLLAAPLLAQPGGGCQVKVRDAAAPNADHGDFAATQVLDIALVVILSPSTTGDHLVRLRVLAPSGNLYQELAVAFSGASTAGAPRSRTVAGYPRPLPVQAPRRDPGTGRPRVTATLPVAGTAIVSSSLYGQWRVEAYLDGASAPCDTAKFRLRS